MTAFTLGSKSDSTQLFDDQGRRIPVTFVKTTPCYLVDIKWPEHDGYMSVKLGFGPIKNFKKVQAGQTKKAGINTPLRFLREIRLKTTPEKIEDNKKIGLKMGEVSLYIGDEIKPATLFKKGDIVDVSGTSKGKGFQGVVKRHHFAGGPKTHGQSDRWRAPGSMGQSTTPGRVYKGKRMAGHMGSDRVTIKNLQVVDVNDEGIFVKGVIPGAKSGLIEVKSV